MAISSLVFYILAARAPLVSLPQHKPLCIPSIDQHQAHIHITTAQTSLPRPQRPNNHHLLHNLPGPLNRPRHNLQPRARKTPPQTRPQHQRRILPPNPLAALHQLGPNLPPPLHKPRPDLRPARCEPAHWHRGAVCHARLRAFRHLCWTHPGEMGLVGTGLCGVFDCAAPCGIPRAAGSAE